MESVVNLYTPFKDRIIDFKQHVLVYRNLTRSGYIWSIKQNNMVVAHATQIHLKECECLINHKAQKRIRQTKKREVHAYVKGYISDVTTPIQYKMTYNPFNYDYFFTMDKFVLPLAIQGAKYACFNNKGVSVAGIW